jgi:hypothetical protein
LVGKPERKRPLERARYVCEEYIITGSREIR